MAGCLYRSASTDYVTPWFRVSTSARYVRAPHAIEWGGVARAELRVGRGWRLLPHFGRAHPVGDAVAIEDGEALVKGVFLYHPGKTSAHSA